MALDIAEKLHYYALDDDVRGKAIYYVERGKDLREAVAEIIRLREQVAKLIKADPDRMHVL